MFCGGQPCVCDGGKTKKSSRSTRKASSPKETSSLSPNSTPSINDSNDEETFGAIPEPARPKFDIKSPSEDRDLSLESALRLLRPLVCPRDQKFIDQKLKRTYPQDVDRRVEEWKARYVQE